MIGDSNSGRNASGSGGDDLLDLGGGISQTAIGDHNIDDPRGGTAFGAGNDRIIGSDETFPPPGGSDVIFTGELLIGDSSVNRPIPRSAGHDAISGRGGHDVLFGDNTNFAGTRTFGPVGGNDDLDGGDGVDRLRAGPGNDDLDGGPDAPDDCNGEAGTDTAIRCEIIRRVP